MLNGILNFLQLVNDNWTTICVIIGLVIGIYEKIKTYLAKSRDERLVIAKKQIEETILAMVANAEINYEDWNKAGVLKRSEVIKQIYDKMPILAKAVNQDTVIAFIDEQIDKSLGTLKDVIYNKE